MQLIILRDFLNMLYGPVTALLRPSQSSVRLARWRATARLMNVRLLGTYELDLARAALYCNIGVRLLTCCACLRHVSANPGQPY